MVGSGYVVHGGGVWVVHGGGVWVVHGGGDICIFVPQTTWVDPHLKKRQERCKQTTYFHE